MTYGKAYNQPMTRREVVRHAKRKDVLPNVAKSAYERLMQRQPEDDN